MRYYKDLCTKEIANHTKHIVAIFRPDMDYNFIFHFVGIVNKKRSTRKYFRVKGNILILIVLS